MAAQPPLHANSPEAVRSALRIAERHVCETQRIAAVLLHVPTALAVLAVRHHEIDEAIAVHAAVGMLVDDSDANR